MKYNVFLSYNRRDVSFVNTIADILINQYGMSLFFDKWDLMPGKPWQEEIEKALSCTESFAIFIGKSGMGPWQTEEMRTALSHRSKNSELRVIPILLPGFNEKEQKLPAFLNRFTWVDFRSGLTDRDAIEKLSFGIFGETTGNRAGSFKDALYSAIDTVSALNDAYYRVDYYNRFKEVVSPYVWAAFYGPGFWFIFHEDDDLSTLDVTWPYAVLYTSIFFWIATKVSKKRITKHNNNKDKLLQLIEKKRTHAEIGDISIHTILKAPCPKCKRKTFCNLDNGKAFHFFRRSLTALFKMILSLCATFIVIATWIIDDMFYIGIFVFLTLLLSAVMALISRCPSPIRSKYTCLICGSYFRIREKLSH